MNYIPRRAAIVACNRAEAEFAESTISAHGLEVARFDSAYNLADHLRTESVDGPVSTGPDIAVLAGSTAELAEDSVNILSDLVPVMVATSTTTVADAVDLMKRGAKDVVELPCSREELWQRVSHALQAGDTDAACKAQKAEMRVRFEQLTPAEVEVVDAMLDGLSNKQIAQRLKIGLRTVELRRSKIMRKMQAGSVAELVKFICLAEKLQPKSREATS